MATIPAQQAHDLHELLQHVRSAPDIWLPARVHMGRRGWLWRGMQHVESVRLWLYASLALSTWMALAHAAWWAALGMVAVTWGVRHIRGPVHTGGDGLPLEWNGWHLDVNARTLARIGKPPGAAAQAIDMLQLEPAAMWSVGVLMGDEDDHQAIYAWRIELRHRSRGPVAVLSVLHSQSAARTVMADWDALADALAQRLGIRRTGSRLVAHPRGGR